LDDVSERSPEYLVTPRFSLFLDVRFISKTRQSEEMVFRSENLLKRGKNLELSNLLTPRENEIEL